MTCVRGECWCHSSTACYLWLVGHGCCDTGVITVSGNDSRTLVTVCFFIVMELSIFSSSANL